MPRPLKWLLFVAVAVIVFVVTAVLIAPLVIDVNKYKPQIQKAVSDRIGRPLRLGGSIEPSVFPWIGIALNDVHLGNPDKFEEKDIYTI